MDACLVNNPHDGIVAQMAPVIEVAHLDLKFIVKLVGRLLLKFDAWHAQVLQQFLSEGQAYPFNFSSGLSITKKGAIPKGVRL